MQGTREDRIRGLPERVDAYNSYYKKCHVCMLILVKFREMFGDGQLGFR